MIHRAFESTLQGSPQVGKCGGGGTAPINMTTLPLQGQTTSPLSTSGSGPGRAFCPPPPGPSWGWVHALFSPAGPNYATFPPWDQAVAGLPPTHLRGQMVPTTFAQVLDQEMISQIWPPGGKS